MATKAPKPAAARRVETLQQDEARRKNIQTAEYQSVLEKQIQAVLDPYNPTGSTRHVAFNTTKTERCATDAHLCHVNWVALDSDWEAEFCRVAEKHPRVRAYEKNRNLGLEVPYRYRAEMRKHRPDFIVRIDDRHGDDDLLKLVVEIKGYRGEDAKEKKSTMDNYWVPGVNRLGSHGRWSFAEFTDVYAMQHDLAERIEEAFDGMIGRALRPAVRLEGHAHRAERRPE